MDIIGLTEINDGRIADVQKIVDVLNTLTGKHFAYVGQNQEDTVIPAEYLDTRFGKAQQEQVAIIYDTALFRPVGFRGKNNQIGASYKESIRYYKKTSSN
ncbi:hypothetical protein [Mycoplasmopsis gallopavonis]|uniref:Uncharacterized protein n=1 Tax=Mycoplasmopsis gallopavonis TaxID=76629 RepID=A0A449B017_9BACT|nr:hypothetical protein [Mycoplasmopsis gallopavonis]RIV16186.1 hypothetical protein D1113_03245 [Mycoplasmopsis gallopavonis]VEU73084.1 Uncharacterised protein [Mycoplasmopsis gallopavonis]